MHMCVCSCAPTRPLHSGLAQSIVAMAVVATIATWPTFTSMVLLWHYLICTLFDRTSVTGFTVPQPRNRSVRQLQATMLSNASQALTSVGSPPANATIYSSSLRPGWVVKSIGRGQWQQPVAGAGTNGSQAFCATLPTMDVSVPKYVYAAVFTKLGLQNKTCEAMVPLNLTD